MRTRKSAPPERRGLFLGFFDEVDAASGARGCWRRDPDGDRHTAGAVRRKANYDGQLAAEISRRSF